jgi:SAM-dependent methyltransferase
MPADPRIYDSERLARYYSQTRPPIHQGICAKLFAALPEGFKARTALDIGCGAGVSTAVLVPHAANVIGIDPYLSMLLQARRRVPEALFVQATATSLPASTASIDLVTAAGSLNYTDVNLSIAEVARVLAPEGYLAVYDFSTGRVSPEGGLAEFSFLSFERRFPWPPGYAMALDRLPFNAHGLSLLYFETFVVELPMSADDYVEYILGETNVEAAVSAGLSEFDARQSCRQIFEPLFAQGPQKVRFDSVLAVATNSVCLTGPRRDA